MQASNEIISSISSIIKEHPKTALATTAATGLGIVWLQHYAWKQKLPPMIGMSLPYIGSLGFIRRGFLQNDLATYLINEAKKLKSDIISVYMFGTVWVFCVSNDAIRKIMIEKGAQTSGRFVLFQVEDSIFSSRRGVVNAEGQVWQVHRQVVVKALKDLGVGSSKMFESICEESRYLIDNLSKLSTYTNRKQLKTFFQYASSGVVSQLNFGHRIDDVSILEAMFNNSEEMLKVLAKFDIKKYIPGVKSDLENAIEKSFRPCIDYIKNEIVIHLKNQLDEGEGDLISIMLEKRKVMAEYFTDNDIVAVILELYNAGTGTTSETMYWAMYHIRNNKELQNEIRNEISEVLGTRSLEYKDIENLPKLNAFVNETLRYTPIVEGGVLHKATENFQINGYSIPKNSIIMGVQYNPLHDPKYWKHPDTFNIDNFLNDDRTKFEPHHHYSVEFGEGPRKCLGERLARMQLLIYVTSILQTFEVAYHKDWQSFNETKMFGSLRELGVKFIPL